MTRGAAGRTAVFFGLLAALPFVFTAHWIVNIAVFAVMYAALATAWNLVGGYAGYPSLGHAAFFGAGAYAEAIWFTHKASAGYTPLVAALVVGLGVAVVGLPIGWIAMRTRADVFAIVTITLLFVVQTLAFNLRSLTGGSQGIAMPTPSFSASTFERPFYYAMLALLALGMAVSFGMLRSRAGLSLLALRADEDKARGIGVHVTLVKLVAFVASVGLTAAVGAVWAYYVSFVYPQFAVDPLVTIGMVLMAYLGGRATLWGPVLGALLVASAQQYLAFQFGSTQLYLVAYAAVFLVIMLLLPQGILPSVAERRTRRARATRVAAAQAALVGTAADSAALSEGRARL